MDRRIKLSIGRSRKDTNWTGTDTTISALYERLKTPVRGTESYDAYTHMSKGQQDALKDVGGFVAGSLDGGRRKASAVVGRDVITLDLDTIPAYATDTVLRAIANLKYSYCVYSTRKHTPTAPRLRVLFPLDRTANPDEYEAVARRIASQIGIQMADPSTFEPSRLMYWPSCCADGEYVYMAEDGELANVDRTLATYNNWRDYTEWPQVPGHDTAQRMAVKQGDPESKPGIVGAFNRTYDIPSAIEKYLDGVYIQCDNDCTRYTYSQGSTTGGAVLYDGSKFLYSHHATDPCGGRLVNAFDMVRIHKYGDLDDTANADTPVNSLPSYKEMIKLAGADERVASLQAQERAEEALAELNALTVTQGTGAPTVSPEIELSNLIQELDKHPKNGTVKSTIDNVRIILEKDPNLRGKFALNEFSNQVEVFGSVPWSASDTARRRWTDTDNNGLYWYLEKVYGITTKGNIDSALDIHAVTHSFNEVGDYLNSLHWDGTPRLDTLLIDVLGAEDDEYTRAVTRKAFTAAVARAKSPGCKYDNMLIMCGPQGLGKSTLIDRMSKGWYNDSIRTFEGKEASELLQGVWLVEIAELDAFRRTEVSRVKQFLSLRSDRYRAAYGKNISELPRRCVFFGTCNVSDFLQDATGNRRFWPVDVGVNEPKQRVWELTDADIDQLWAEAFVRWQMGEQLYLTGDVEIAAKAKQEDHRDTNFMEGLVQDFLEREIPMDWDKWNVDKRRDYWANNLTYDGPTAQRTKVSSIEVWCEVLGGSLLNYTKANARDVNTILENLQGWTRGATRRCGPYKMQRVYIRDGEEEE